MLLTLSGFTLVERVVLWRSSREEDAAGTAIANSPPLRFDVTCKGDNHFRFVYFLCGFRRVIHRTVTRPDVYADTRLPSSTMLNVNLLLFYSFLKIRLLPEIFASLPRKSQLSCSALTRPHVQDSSSDVCYFQKTHTITDHETDNSNCVVCSAGVCNSRCADPVATSLFGFLSF